MVDKYTNISSDEFNDIFSKDFIESTYVNLRLYKGIASNEELGDYYFAEPRKGHRESKTVKENGNSYNLLLNNLPSWLDLPLRQKSIITSSSFKTAEVYAQKKEKAGLLYGKTYVVLPLSGSPIVIAPKSDILYSFHYALSIFKLRPYKYDLVNFNIFINEIVDSSNLPNDFDKDWEIFAETLTKIVFDEDLPRKKISWEREIF